MGLNLLAVRNVAKWSQAALPIDDDRRESWEVLSALAAQLMGLGELPAQALDDVVLRQYATAAVEGAAWEGLEVEEMLEKVAGDIGPRRLVDLLLRLGPYGDGFGRRPEGLTLQKVEAAEHGLDLGPLTPRLDEVLNTESGAIELCPGTMRDDLPRLRSRMETPADELVLIGRRDMRATNSFMHNLPALVKGRDRCTLQVSQKDAERLGLEAKGSARITSRTGSVLAPIEITDDLMPGVVSLPHGWGHDDAASGQSVAKAHPGVNANVLTDDRPLRRGERHGGALRHPRYRRASGLSFARGGAGGGGNLAFAAPSGSLVRRFGRARRRRRSPAPRPPPITVFSNPHPGGCRMTLSLQEISDRMEIQDLVYRYSEIIDGKQFDALRDEIFSEDAHIDYSAFGGSVGNVEETITFLKKAMPMFPHTQHSNTNAQIRVDGDTATGRVMCFNPQEMDLPGGQGRQVMMFGLWYLDEYVRTDAGWRIQQRSEEKSWVFNTPDFMKL